MSRLQKILIVVFGLYLSLVNKQIQKVSANEVSGLTVSEDGKLYTNEMFDLSISKPANWYSQSIEELLQSQQRGANLVSGNNQNLQATIQESLKVSLPLFSFYQHLPGTPNIKANANISGVAENIYLSPGIKKGCDYLYHVKNLMAQSQIQINYEDNCQTKNINGSELGYFDATINVNNIEVKQRYLSCIKDTHAIAVIQTYFDPESEHSVNKILNTLKIDCN